VVAIRFKESAPHSSFDWHDAPESQYVITLCGTLEFTTRDGEKFILRPGDVLIATDDAGSGHKWRLIDDSPWCRAYVVLKPGAGDCFVPSSPASAKTGWLERRKNPCEAPDFKSDVGASGQGQAAMKTVALTRAWASPTSFCSLRLWLGAAAKRCPTTGTQRPAISHHASGDCALVRNVIAA